MNQLRILILEKENLVSDSIRDFISREGIVIYKAAGTGVALQMVDHRSIDIVIIDLNDIGTGSYKFVQKLKSGYPEIDIIGIDRKGNDEKPETGTGKPFYDFFSKPFYWKEIERSICKTISFFNLRNFRDSLGINLTRVNELLFLRNSNTLIGQSTQVMEVANLMLHASVSPDTSVLIWGESGTGKDLIARGIHALSIPDNKGFISVNCASVPLVRFESEFFGEELKPGEKVQGWFEAANNGTLFLKGIDELSKEMQAKLLSVMDNRNIYLVGSHQQITLNQRIIASISLNPEEAVKQDKIRLDLLNRINAFQVRISPLRERKEDIPAFLAFFISHFSSKLHKQVRNIDDRALTRLINYSFPGNVRELKNRAERAVILSRGNTLKIEHFDLPDDDPVMASHPDPDYSDLSLAGAERAVIIKALTASGHNKVKAARILGISRQALDRKISRFRIP